MKIVCAFLSSFEKSAITQPTAVAMVAKVRVILIYLVMKCLELLSAGSHVLCVELFVSAPYYGRSKLSRLWQSGWKRRADTT